MEEDRGYMVVIPEHVKKQIEEASPEVKEEIEKLVQDFVSGAKDPLKMGKRVVIGKCKEKLPCAECGSKNIVWTIEKEDREVYFVCNDCGESAWMTEEEFEKAKQENRESVFS